MIVIYENDNFEVMGLNNYGQLGLGDHINRRKLSINPVMSKQKILKVSCGYEHVIAMMNNQTVFGWGSNREGQLGIGRDTKEISTPLLIYFQQSVIDIACGKNHSLFITEMQQEREEDSDTKPKEVYDCSINNTTIFKRINEEKEEEKEDLDLLRKQYLHNLDININDEINTLLGNDLAGNLEKIVYTEEEKKDKKLDKNSHMDSKEELKSNSESLSDLNEDIDTSMQIEKKRKTIQIFACGNGSHGKLGFEKEESVYYPKQINLDNVLKKNDYIHSIYSNCEHNAMITKRGKLFTWGFNKNGELGINSTKSSYKLKSIHMYNSQLKNERILKVSLGKLYSACLTTSQQFFIWGNNILKPKKFETSTFKIIDFSCNENNILIQTDQNILFLWSSSKNVQNLNPVIQSFVIKEKGKRNEQIIYHSIGNGLNYLYVHISLHDKKSNLEKKNEEVGNKERADDKVLFSQVSTIEEDKNTIVNKRKETPLSNIYPMSYDLISNSIHSQGSSSSNKNTIKIPSEELKPVNESIFFRKLEKDEYKEDTSEIQRTEEVETKPELDIEEKERKREIMNETFGEPSEIDVCDLLEESSIDGKNTKDDIHKFFANKKKYKENMQKVNTFHSLLLYGKKSLVETASALASSSDSDQSKINKQKKKPMRKKMEVYSSEYLQKNDSFILQKIISNKINNMRDETDLDVMFKNIQNLNIGKENIQDVSMNEQFSDNGLNHFMNQKKSERTLQSNDKHYFPYNDLFRTIESENETLGNSEEKYAYINGVLWNTLQRQKKINLLYNHLLKESIKQSIQLKEKNHILQKKVNQLSKLINNNIVGKRSEKKNKKLSSVSNEKPLHALSLPLLNDGNTEDLGILENNSGPLHNFSLHQLDSWHSKNKKEISLEHSIYSLNISDINYKLPNDTSTEQHTINNIPVFFLNN